MNQSLKETPKFSVQISSKQQSTEFITFFQVLASLPRGHNKSIQAYSQLLFPNDRNYQHNTQCVDPHPILHMVTLDNRPHYLSLKGRYIHH